MTNPPGPEVPQPPAYQPPPPAATASAEPAPPTYAAPAYAPPPAPAYAALGPNAPVPGKTLGIVALIVAIFFNVIGLILGIVALVQSRKAGVKNGPAVAAIIVGAVLFVLGVIIAIIAIAAITAGASEIARLCAEYGSGVHQINGVNVNLSCG